MPRLEPAIFGVLARGQLAWLGVAARFFGDEERLGWLYLLNRRLRRWWRDLRAPFLAQTRYVEFKKSPQTLKNLIGALEQSSGIVSERAGRPTARRSWTGSRSTRTTGAEARSLRTTRSSCGQRCGRWRAADRWVGSSMESSKHERPLGRQLFEQKWQMRLSLIHI